MATCILITSGPDKVLQAEYFDPDIQLAHVNEIKLNTCIVNAVILSIFHF